MNKKLIISLSVIGAVAAIAVGGTIAYFSDTETSTGNTFTAGTLNLVPTTAGTGPSGKYTVTAGGEGVNGNVVFINLAPSESGSITWTLQNTGSLVGYLDFESVAVTFGPGLEPEPETAVSTNDASGGDLDLYLGVKLTRDGTYILGDASNYVPASGLAAVLTAEINKSLAVGATTVYVLSWSIPSDIASVDDNIIQGDTMGIDVTFELGQDASQ
jgi:predicted ribosomally synthesized peptide with SipW-like signal peptide